MKNVISTDKAPAAIGPYSQAIEVNGTVYTSGIIPVVPATGEIPEGSVAQAQQAFENLSNLLEAAGTGMDKVVKTTVFIKEMNDFAAINEVYAKFFPSPFPSRSRCGKKGAPTGRPGRTGGFPGRKQGCCPAARKGRVALFHISGSRTLPYPKGNG